MNEIRKITIEKKFEPKTFGDFVSQSVFTKEFPNVYIGGDASISKDWKVGDVVEVLITEKEKNGKVYKNFSLPKKADVAVGMAANATERITKLEARVTTIDLSLERRVRELFAELKADLVLELTGKFQTTKDYNKSQEPHPILQSSNPLDGVPPEDQPPF